MDHDDDNKAALSERRPKVGAAREAPVAARAETLSVTVVVEGEIAGSITVAQGSPLRAALLPIAKDYGRDTLDGLVFRTNGVTIGDIDRPVPADLLIVASLDNRIRKL